MARIRVNTEDVKNKAKDFDSAAEAFKRAGDDILAAAMAMPYNGQLSGPARKAGYEIQKQARELSTALAGDAESLRKTAQAFEEIDNQSVKIIEENSILLSSTLLPGGPGGEDGGPIRKGGNPDLLCYYDYGDTIIIWKFGESIIITVTDENRALVEQYEKAVDEFGKSVADLFETYKNLILQGINAEKIFWVFALLVGADILTGGLIDELFGPTAAAVVAGASESFRDMAGLSMYDIVQKCGVILDPVNPSKYINELEKLVKDDQVASQSYSEAQEAWYALAPKTPSGPSVPVPAPPPQTPTQTPPPPTTP